MGRWLHVLPLLAGLLAVGWFGSALRHVGEGDALQRTYQQSGTCAAGQSPGDGCRTWFRAWVTDVEQPTAYDSATRVSVRLADGETKRLDLWRPPASFRGLAVGEAVSVGTVSQGWLMDLRRDASGAVIHTQDYPGYWGGVFVSEALFGLAAGLPLILWGLFGLVRRRGWYPLWAICLLPAAWPAINVAADMEEAPHALTWGAYLPTAVTAAVGLAVGLLLSWGSARWFSARAARRALPTSPGWSPWSSAPR